MCLDGSVTVVILLSGLILNHHCSAVNLDKLDMVRSLVYYFIGGRTMVAPVSLLPWRHHLVSVSLCFSRVGAVVFILCIYVCVRASFYVAVHVTLHFGAL